MSNYAALIAPLSISGSRLSDGTANASGKVWVFEPGTSTPVDVYSDAAATAVVTQPITLTNGGLLNRSSLPGGIFATQPIRLYIEDVTGTVVSDAVYIPATAGDVGINNDATTATTLDAYITQGQTSTGGTNLSYLESGGATERPIQDKFRELGISVKDFGAVGDGVAIDTTAIQNAMSRAKALSTNVLFPAGTYKTDQALTLTSAAGVKLLGAGRGVTIITPTHATANCFTLSACASSGISGMSILHTTGSTGAAVSVGGASPNFKAADLYIPADATYVGFAYGLDFSSTSGLDLLSHCQVVGSTRTLRLNCSSTTTPSVLISNALGATGADPVPSTVCIEFNGSRAGYSLVGNFIYGNTSAILYNAAFTGARVRMFGNVIFSTGAATIDMSAFAADRDLLRQWGNDVDGYTVNVLSGATVTPDRSKGRHIRIAGTTTGAAYTVAAPTPAPSLGSLYDLDLYISFVNAAGGAITGWTMNAVYHLSAGPSTTDTQVTSYHLKWDVTASVWREFSRTVTT
jgi:hypothetical protein